MVTIACRILKETAAAILIYDPETDEQVWFPLEQVEEIHRDKTGFGRIVVSDWIAEKKGY